MNNICPICNDKAIKVESIYQKGSSSSDANFIDGNWQSIKLTTNLARTLAPPLEPKLPLDYGWYKWVILILMIAVAISCLCLTIFMYQNLSGLFNAKAGSTDGSDFFNQLVMYGIPCAVSAFFVAFGLAVFFLQNSRDKQKKAKYANEMSRWKIARQRWEDLYFCERDYIVFDPDTKETCKPESINSFIYR